MLFGHPHFQPRRAAPDQAGHCGGVEARTPACIQPDHLRSRHEHDTRLLQPNRQTTRRSRGDEGGRTAGVGCDHGGKSRVGHDRPCQRHEERSTAKTSPKLPKAWQRLRQSGRAVGEGGDDTARVNLERTPVLVVQHHGRRSIERTHRHHRSTDRLDRSGVQPALAITTDRPGLGRGLLLEDPGGEQQVELAPEVLPGQRSGKGRWTGALTQPQQQCDQRLGHGRTHCA